MLVGLLCGSIQELELAQPEFPPLGGMKLSWRSSQDFERLQYTIFVFYQAQLTPQ